MERQEESIRLGFESCEDMLAKLEREGARLLKGHQADDVMNFCMTGHHLVQDWVREVGTDAMRKRRDMISGEAKTVVQILYDVSNGSKHFRLTRKSSKASRVLEKSYAQPVDDWWNYFFAPILNYETRHIGLNHELFVSQILGYLSWIVHGTEDTVPQHLLDELAALRKPVPPVAGDSIPDGQ